MKKILSSLALLLLLLSMGTAWAEFPNSVDKAPEAFGLGQPSRQELYQRWAGIRKKVDGKDFEGARADLLELQGRCADLGITSFEELSASMVKEGKVLLDASDVKGAFMLFDFASKISPDYPPPYYAKGWAYFKQDKLKALLTLDAFIEGFRNSFNDFWWVFFYTGNKIASLLFTVAALFSLYGLFTAVRYTPLFAHDLSEALKKQSLEKTFKYAVIPSIFLLILIILGYWWAVSAAFLSLWVYFNKREKFVAMVFFGLLVFMPEIMGNFANFVQAGGNKLLWVMDDANKGKITRSSEEYLRALLDKGPEDEAAIFSLAQVEKKKGNYNEAENLYEKLISIRPDSPVYLNNLGNIHFLTKRNDEAIKDYTAAVQRAPKSVLPYFNLSQAYGENLMFTERDRADLAASELDPNLVARLRDVPSNTPQRMVFDEKIPTRSFWRTAFREKDPELAGLFWSTSVKVLPLKGARLAGISLIVLALALNAFRKKGIYSHFCGKCGKVSCRKCQKPFYNKELCPQCHQIFVKLDGVEARDRVRKMLEMRETQAKKGIIYRVCSLFIPGSGHFLLGHPIRGFIFMGAFIFLLKDIFFGNFFEVPYDFNMPFIRPDIFVLGIFLILFYVIAQYDTHELTK